MFRRILTVIRKDLLTGSRESMITYIVLSPLLLAFGMRLLLPLLEEPAVTFAVTGDLDTGIAATLQEHGRLLVLPDREAVLERVRRIDDVPGVVPGAGSGVDALPEILLEGNEQGWVAALPGIVLDAAAAQLPVQATYDDLGGSVTRLRYILASLTTFAILLMGGVIVGLVVIEEKEQATLRVFTTSPVRFGEYLAAKTLVATSMGLFLGLVVAWIILGGEMPLLPVFVAALGALPAALLLGFLLAALANDQIVAVALLKTMLFFFTSVPIAGFFVAGVWLIPLSLMTNHHAIQALYSAMQPGAAIPWAPLAWSLITGVPLVAATVLLLRKRLGFGTDAYLAVEPVQADPNAANPEQADAAA